MYSFTFLILMFTSCAVAEESGDSGPQPKIAPSTQKKESGPSLDDLLNKVPSRIPASTNNEARDTLRELDIMVRATDRHFSGRKRRSFDNTYELWTDSTLYYAFEDNYYRSESFKKNFAGVIADFEALTCIRLVERTNQRNYLAIGARGGCWSYIGMSGGRQEFSLDAGCGTKRVITHELIHALGFNHEQTRPDRDEFVNIHFDNMNDMYTYQFDKIDRSTWDKLGSPYDYESIMHYGTHYFSNNHKATIETIDPFYQNKIGKFATMSTNDIRQLNKAYKCRGNNGYDLNQEYGEIKSPNFPNNYPSSTVREWRITVPENGVIRFRTRSFHLEPSSSCEYDYLEIFEGHSTTGRSISGKHCNEDGISDVRTSGNTALVRFNADESSEFEGFILTFQTEFNNAGSDSVPAATAAPGPRSLYRRFAGNCKGNMLHTTPRAVDLEECKLRCTYRGNECRGFSYKVGSCYLKSRSCSSPIPMTAFTFYEKTQNAEDFSNTMNDATEAMEDESSGAVIHTVLLSLIFRLLL